MMDEYGVDDLVIGNGVIQINIFGRRQISKLQSQYFVEPQLSGQIVPAEKEKNHRNQKTKKPTGK